MQADFHGSVIYSAVALLDSVLCVIPDLTSLSLAEPQLALRLTWVGACDMMLTEIYLTNINHRSARERIAFMALELYRRLEFPGLNNGYSIPVPLKQDNIADALGLMQIHVNRTLHAFKEEGILEIHKHELTALDYAAICALAGSDLEPISVCDIALS